MPNGIVTTSTSSASHIGGRRNLPKLLPNLDLVTWAVAGVCLVQGATPRYRGPYCQLFFLNALLTHRRRLVPKGEGRVEKATVHTFLLVSRASHA